MKSDKQIEKRSDWLKRSGLYRGGGRGASQNCEDLVARRILSGLGVTEKAASKLEAYFELEYDGSMPLFDRAARIVEHASRGEVARRDALKYGMQCRDGDANHAIVTGNLDELVAAADAHPNGLLLFARVGSAKNALCYVVVQDGEYPSWLLQPPSVFLARHGGHAIWYREVTDLVYDMSVLCRWDLPS